MAEIPNAGSVNRDEEDNHIIFNIEKRRVYVFGKIGRDAALEMQSLIDEFKEHDIGKKNNEPITLVLNTEGGLAYQGLAIFDLIINSGLNFRTVILGEVASAGLVIALAGQERWMYKHACLKFHATAMQFAEPKKGLEQQEEDIQQGWKKVVNKLYDEITIANSNLTIRQIRRLERQEISLTAEQALKLGLIHKII